jgi:hypothetical protein
LEYKNKREWVERWGEWEEKGGGMVLIFTKSSHFYSLKVYAHGKPKKKP